MTLARELTDLAALAEVPLPEGMLKSAILDGLSADAFAAVIYEHCETVRATAAQEEVIRAAAKRLGVTATEIIGVSIAA